MKRYLFLIPVLATLALGSWAADAEFKAYGTVNTDNAATSVLTFRVASESTQIGVRNYVRVVNTSDALVYILFNDSTTAPAASITNCSMRVAATSMETVIFENPTYLTTIGIKNGGAIGSGTVLIWGR